MGARRSGREAAVQFLYQYDAHRPAQLDEALAQFWRQTDEPKAVQDFATDLLRGALEKIPEIDAKIRTLADNWDFERIAVVDRNILRLAIYEMLFRPEIPPVVSINEAIEIAKKFSTAESGKFVNGLLDRVKTELSRPGRQAGRGRLCFRRRQAYLRGSMALTSFHTGPEGLQKRWILGALGIALLVHLGAAGLFGFYKIPRLETPASHTATTGPFTVKRIEIDAKALDSPQPDPVAKLPTAEPPPSPSQFNLDTSAIEKALQTPQPALAAPAVPEPSRVIAAADLSSGAPFAVADTAQVSAEIAQVRPTELTGNPTTSAKLAQDLISSNRGTSRSPARSPGLPPARAAPPASSRAFPISRPASRPPRPACRSCPSRSCCGCRATCSSISIPPSSSRRPIRCWPRPRP